MSRSKPLPLPILNVFCYWPPLCLSPSCAHRQDVGKVTQALRVFNAPANLQSRPGPHRSLSDSPRASGFSLNLSQAFLMPVAAVNKVLAYEPHSCHFAALFQSLIVRHNFSSLTPNNLHRASLPCCQGFPLFSKGDYCPSFLVFFQQNEYLPQLS